MDNSILAPHELGDLRPVLVGQALGPYWRNRPVPPGYAERLALFPYPARSAGGRLQELTGWSMRDYIWRTEKINTLDYFPGSAGKGDAFPMVEARIAALKKVVDHNLKNRVVVFVGKKVAEAFLLSLDPFVLVHGRRGAWAWVPHTSGINTQYNDPAIRLAARELFSDVRRMAEERIDMAFNSGKGREKSPYELILVREIEKNWVVREDDKPDAEELLLPKSQVDCSNPQRGKVCTFDIPAWLAGDRGLA